MRTKWHESPYVAQAVSITQYAVKAVLKIVIGTTIASSMITGDGYHNLADIVPALIVVLGIWIRRKKWKGYPFQLKEIESVLTLTIGALLAFTGFKIGMSSVLGCLHLVPALDASVRDVIRLPVHEAIHVDRALLWPLVGLMGGSFLFSLMIGSFQIHVGKVSGELALVADGKETMTDGSVEGVGLVGVVLVQRFGWSVAEYLLGFVVMGFVLHTAWEIFKPSLDAILKRSLGEDVEKALEESALATPGVESVRRLATFHIGRTTGACLMTVITRLEANRHAGLRLALERTLDESLKRFASDVRETEIRIDLEEPPPNAKRVAYACRMEGARWRIVSTLDLATHFVIGDILQEDTAKSRFRVEPIVTTPLAVIWKKKVEMVYVHQSEHPGPFPDRVPFGNVENADLETELGVSIYSQPSV